MGWIRTIVPFGCELQSHAFDHSATIDDSYYSKLMFLMLLRFGLIRDSLEVKSLHLQWIDHFLLSLLWSFEM